jgi:hypothetical protein|tara:strand:+ start:1022 stop:1126 length:105 start_codon:yes stop_codon:yes gene_type:complete
MLVLNQLHDIGILLMLFELGFFYPFTGEVVEYKK